MRCMLFDLFCLRCVGCLRCQFSESRGDPTLRKSLASAISKGWFQVGGPIDRHDYTITIPWLYHDYTMTIPWLYHDYTMTIPWLYHDYTMAIPWLYHGYTMAIPWLYHGYTMAIPWLYHGYTMAIPWLYHGYTMAIPWLYHGYTMTVPWLYHDCTMTVPWLYHDCTMTNVRHVQLCLVTQGQALGTSTSAILTLTLITRWVCCDVTLGRCWLCSVGDGGIILARLCMTPLACLAISCPAKWLPIVLESQALSRVFSCVSSY